MSLSSGGGKEYSAIGRDYLTLTAFDVSVEIGIGEKSIAYLPPPAPGTDEAAIALDEGGKSCLRVVKEEGEWHLIIREAGTVAYRNTASGSFTIEVGGKIIELQGEGEIFLEAGNYKIFVMPIPEKFALKSAVPNPFNATTLISFDFAAECKAKLEIFDISGRKIRTLIEGESHPGTYSVVWNGRSDDGGELSSGIYLYRLSTNAGFSETKRLILLK